MLTPWGAKQGAIDPAPPAGFSQPTEGSQWIIPCTTIRGMYVGGWQDGDLGNREYATQGGDDARTTRVALPWANLSGPFRAKGTRSKKNVRLVSRNRGATAMARPDGAAGRLNVRISDVEFV
jgi:hypothetical protein